MSSKRVPVHRVVMFYPDVAVRIAVCVVYTHESDREKRHVVPAKSMWYAIRFSESCRTDCESRSEHSSTPTRHLACDAFAHAAAPRRFVSIDSQVITLLFEAVTCNTSFEIAGCPGYGYQRIGEQTSCATLGDRYRYLVRVRHSAFASLRHHMALFYIVHFPVRTSTHHRE